MVVAMMRYLNENVNMTGELSENFGCPFETLLFDDGGSGEFEDWIDNFTMKSVVLNEIPQSSLNS
jgi:hypothetical protein